MAAPPAGTPTTTATSRRSACSTWCATRWPGLGIRLSRGRRRRRPRFRQSVAAWCALLRPDVFRSVALMSAPFAGPPALPFNTANAPATTEREDPVHRELAALPRPRKYYQCTIRRREANADMLHAPQGVHDFLRAYYHHKSADWKGNKPLSSQVVDRGRAGQDADLLCDGFCRRHGRDGGGGHAFGGEIAANHGCPSASLPSTAPNMSAPDSRAACNGIAAAPGSVHRRNCRPCRAAASTCRPVHLGQTGLGHLPAPRRFERCSKAPARAWSAATWSTAPATGCNRSSRTR